MNSLNSILLEGALTEDPEQKTLPAGGMVCTFSIASNRFYKQDQALVKEVSSFDVEALGRLGEVCAQNLVKGRGVRVVGRLASGEGRVWIVAEHVEFKPVAQSIVAEA